MMQQANAFRTARDSASLPAPGQILAALPSRAALTELIAGDALSEPGVVAVDGGRGVGKTAMVGLVADRLRGRGRLVVPVAGPFSRSPLSPVTPARITDALLLASGTVDDSDDIPPDRLLRSLLTQPGLRDLILLIDDADALPPATWRFLDLLLGLARFGQARLRLVLFGAPGRWPDPSKLRRLRPGLMTRRIIEPLSRAEAARYATTVAEQTGQMLDRVRLDRILDRADGSLIQLDAAVRDTTSVLSRTAARLMGGRRLWPALALGGPVLAGAVAFTVLADRPDQVPADAPPTAVASAEVAPLPPAAALPAPAISAPALPAPAISAQAQLRGAVASGKGVAGASALGMVLAHLEVTGLAPGALPLDRPPQQPAPTADRVTHGGAVATQPPVAPSPAPAVARVTPDDPSRSASDGLSPVRGLLLVARPGDTLAALYSEVYRGRSAPPFTDISAANPAPVRPGALVVFPAPPGGWAKPGTAGP